MFSSTSAMGSLLDSETSHILQLENKKNIQDHMEDAAIISFDCVFKEFFKRIMRTKDDDAAFEKLQEVVQEISKDPGLSVALNNYKTSGDAEKVAYEPLVLLFNQVLDTIRDGAFRTRLDEHLRSEDPKRRIKFIRCESLNLEHNWPVDTLGAYTAFKPDLLVVFEADIEDFAEDQVKRQPKNEGYVYKPRGVGIGFNSVVSCIELKREKGGAKQSSDLGVEASTETSNQLGSNGPKRLGKRKYQESQQSEISRKEQKREATSPRNIRGQAAQLGTYAAELLSRGPYAMHTIGLAMSYGEVTVCWFDRQGAIIAYDINIFTEFEKFVGLIVAFSRFSFADWGIDAALYPTADGTINIPLSGTSGDGTVIVKMDSSPLCHRVALCGRGTCVLRGVFTSGGTSTNVAVKISHPQRGRESEVKFIEMGVNIDGGRYAQNLPKIHGIHEPDYTTRNIRDRLQIPDMDENLSRQPRIIVFEHLESIMSLEEPILFYSAWFDCICVHRAMWESNIRHGDISLGNLMYRWRDGKPIGVLNDWDLASDLATDVQEVDKSKARTGTIPFAALDLIDEDFNAAEYDPRLYRFDIESFKWCSAYGCLYTAENQQFLNSWCDPRLSHWTRFTFLSTTDEYKPRDDWEGLYGFVCRFLSWFMTNIAERERCVQAVQQTATRAEVASFSGNEIEVKRATSPQLNLEAVSRVIRAPITPRVKKREMDPDDIWNLIQGPLANMEVPSITTNQ